MKTAKTPRMGVLHGSPTRMAIASNYGNRQTNCARIAIKHTFRFFKQTLKWMPPNLRTPEAADRWLWLLLLAYVQLRLAREQVTDVGLPWQPAPRPRPSDAHTGRNA